jgi:ABC-type multidrug transport system fused ATPase/permease subunit
LHYSDRPIMILDEPTSAIDPWTEKKWLKSLKKSSKNKTVIIITHRLSTARIADHVIVLKKGKVVEIGPPDDLKRSDGYFAGIELSNRRQI